MAGDLRRRTGCASDYRLFPRLSKPASDSIVSSKPRQCPARPLKRRERAADRRLRRWPAAVRCRARCAVDPIAHERSIPMTNLSLYDPFADRAVRRPVPRLFRAGARRAGAGRAIKLDVAEKDGAYVVRAEIPGVAKDDIQVSIEGNQVTIGAEVKRESEKKEGERVLHTERYLRQRVSQLHAAGRARRSGERGEVRERRAGTDAREEARARGPQADDPVSTRRRSRAGCGQPCAGAAGSRRARRASAYPLGRVLAVLDVVAEEAPRRRRRA